VPGGFLVAQQRRRLLGMTGLSPGKRRRLLGMTGAIERATGAIERATGAIERATGAIERANRRHDEIS